MIYRGKMPSKRMLQEDVLKSLILKLSVSALLVIAVTAVSGVSAKPKCILETGGSDIYYTWLKSCISAIRRDIPTHTASAQEAAQLFVKECRDIGAWGDSVFVSEFTSRAGGIMPVQSVTPQSTNMIVLMTLRESNISADLDQASQFAKQGNKVIVIARKSLLSKAKALSSSVDLIDNHAAPNGGLIAVNGKWQVPTDPTASIACLWTWTGEFVAACTRLGNTPPMWQSIMVPGAAERNAKYAGRKFLDQCPPAVSAGKIGKEYLNALEKTLAEVYTKDGATIKAAAKQASRAKTAGGNLYAAFMGHALEVQLGCDFDPGVFKPIANAKLTSNDFVLSVGYDRVLSGEEWNFVSERAREAGASVAWSFTSYKPAEVKSVRSNELYIDQRWLLGDAVVSIPGYDVKILPSSGVIGEAILWSITAEILQPEKECKGK